MKCFFPFFSSREREAAERKKEENNRTNTREKNNEKQVIYVRYANMLILKFGQLVVCLIHPTNSYEMSTLSESLWL